MRICAAVVLLRVNIASERTNERAHISFSHHIGFRKFYCVHLFIIHFTLLYTALHTPSVHINIQKRKVEADPQCFYIFGHSVIQHHHH